MYANNAATEAVVAAQLIADGADALAARVAASACLAALTTALFEWAMRDGGSLGEHVEMALDVVVAR